QLNVAAPAAPVVQGREEPEDKGGHVISVFSAKGGACKSVVAANLAILLARRSDKPVALLDADLQFGDTAVMLKLSPQHTVVGAVERTLQLKADILIPSDICVPRSVNKGLPAVLDEPKSGVARSMEQLADLFAPVIARRR